jgi:hypothetical protein
MKSFMIVVGGLVLALYFLTTGYSLGSPVTATVANVAQVELVANVATSYNINNNGQIIPDRDEFIVNAQVIDNTMIGPIPAFEGAVITSDLFLPEGSIIYWDEMARLTHSLGIVVDNMQATVLTAPYYPDEYNGDDYTPFTFKWYKSIWPSNPLAGVFLSSHLGNANPLSIVKVARWGVDEYTEIGYDMATKWGNEMSILTHNAEGYWIQREAVWEGE